MHTAVRVAALRTPGIRHLGAAHMTLVCRYALSSLRAAAQVPHGSLAQDTGCKFDLAQGHRI